MSIRNTYATLLQETWLPSTQLEIVQDEIKYHFVSAGYDTSQPKRGGGVGIILSPRAHKAWQDNEGWMMQFGPNILALKLNIQTGSKKHRGRHSRRIYLVSGYSPSNPDSKTTEMQAYLTNLQNCLKQCKDPKYILIMGTDANISFGTNQDRASNWQETTGKHGIQATGKYQQKSASKLQEILACHKLCLATTFFQSRYKYHTWERKEQKTQIDHIIIKREHLHSTVRHAFATHIPLVLSDHRTIRVILNISTRTCSKQIKTKSIRAGLIDFINSHAGAPEVDDNNQDLIKFRKSIYNDMSQGPINPSNLYNAIQKAAQQLCPPSQNQESQWSKQHSKTLDQLIAQREKAKKDENTHGYWLYRKSIARFRKLEIRRLWDKAIASINADKKMSKAAWKLIQSLKLRPDTLQPLKIPRVKDPTTGENAVTDDRNGEIIAQFLKEKHSQDSPCDLILIGSLPEQKVMLELNDPPSANELLTALLLPKNNTSSGPNAPNYGLLKAAAKDNSIMTLIKRIIDAYWNGEKEMYDEWRSAALAILPKVANP